MSRYRPSLKLSSYVPAALVLIAAAAASFYVARSAVDRIEARTAVDVGRVLMADGQDWVDVTVDGLRLTLSGEAEDEATRFRALSVAGTVVDASRLIDGMTIRPARAITAPEFSIEILRNDEEIALFGLIPQRTDRDAIVSTAQDLRGVDAVTDLMETADFPVPAGWDAAIDYALRALVILDSAKISVTPGAVSVTATADSAEAKTRTIETLTRRAGAAVDIALDIKAPRPVIAPFTTRFVIDAEGARFDACSADTETSRAAILAAAALAGAPDSSDCTVGLGVPTTTWERAVTEGILALAEIGAGTVTFSNADVTLVAADTTPQPLFDKVVGELETALPAVFSLSAVLPEPVKIDGTGDSLTTPEFVATRSPEGLVQMRGRLPDARSRQAVESFAAARFGAGNTYQATRIDPDLPEGWPLRVLTALEALARLNSGAVVVQPAFVDIRGATGDPDSNSAIARLLAERLGEGADYALNVRYVEALDPLAALPTPEECVGDINAALEARKITFAPGSAEIDADAIATIDRIAETLRDCEGVRMEIGGHTDSQGRETMNLQLSQVRADAVLNAIMARRVLTGSLTAKGYGETRPIADNGTEDGRELNRRIEFRLITDEMLAAQEAEAEAEAAAEDAAATADAEEEPSE